MTRHHRSQLSYAKRHAAEQAKILERHVLTDHHRLLNEHQMKITPRTQYPSIAVDEFQRHDAQYRANMTRALGWFRKASICRSNDNLRKYRLQATYELGLLLEMLSGGEYQGAAHILTLRTAPDEDNNPPST